MNLKRYRSKRDFEKTKEPNPKKLKKSKGALQFVIQKHAARRLHYDLRLEVDGVLKSWAVPKGPSLDPQVKRLAIQVEDHPFDYKDFEGVIPEGYGAGSVIIWDRGTYSVEDLSRKESEEAMRQGLKKGELHFFLEGEKLHGRFTLVKLKKEGDEWLFIKSRDDYASTGEITTLKPQSVVSQKVIEEKKASKKSKPPHLKPMLATLIDAPFDDRDWIFEIKWDGYRVLAEIDHQSVDLYSRNRISFNRRFPNIVKHLKELNINAVFDGEIVALDKKGISHFQWLQNTQSEENIFFYVFDLLYLNGHDLTQLPLIERKSLLQNLLKNVKPPILYLDHIESKGISFFKKCTKAGCEGIIGKKKLSLYETGKRTKTWVKIKALLRQEAIICGFTEPQRGRKNLGALLLGVYKNGVLTFAGHVGGGFTDKQLKEMKERLSPDIQKKCPFKKIPKTNTTPTWVKPKWICEVEFREWTDDGIMRQPIFMGLREDKPVKKVVQEKPLEVEEAVKPSQENFDFLTNLDKLYWSKEKITKGELIDYYLKIGPILLKYFKDRPQSLKRYPNGIDQSSFFQKNLVNQPSWVQTIPIKHDQKKINYLLINDTKTLLYAVNLGCIEFHPWLSHYPSLEYPDFLVFDLDPEGISFDHVIEVANVIHSILEKIGAPNLCKTSGASGLHICVPLKAKYTYEQARQFALVVGHVAHQMLPETTSLEKSLKKRQKKVYIDCMQNNYGQTIAAPYSVRAFEGAPISTPLSWNELKKGLHPSDFTMFNILNRIKKKGDLFKYMLTKSLDMDKSLKKIQKHYLQ